jgi:putative nucleotidyltransferase with HDIG domain
MESTVSINDVRVGMFIHLDMGWMRHPFPLSSFRVSSEEQLRALRQLGLSRVRWVPERSELDDGAAAAPAAAPSPEEHPADGSAEARQRRAALALQREQSRRLERQYAEASSALRDASRLAGTHPEQARENAEVLARALLDKLLVDGDMCIRLLSSSAGDRAAAHGMNVAVVALLMGRSLGLSDAEMIDLGVGAMLHDIGKQALPGRVRHADPEFTCTETKLYQEHVAHGVTLGLQMGLAPGALAVLAQHHEQVDGSGFPMRAQGERIAFGARIVALVDRYDNLCNPAVRAAAMTPHEAMSLLFAQCARQYDSTLLNRFIRMMGVYPAGSIVQLTDDRYAMVMSVNSSRPLKPRVLVHDPNVAPDDALHLDLQDCPGLGVRRSLGASRLPPDALAYLMPPRQFAYFFDAVPTASALDAPA